MFKFKNSGFGNYIGLSGVSPYRNLYSPTRPGILSLSEDNEIAKYDLVYQPPLDISGCAFWYDCSLYSIAADATSFTITDATGNTTASVVAGIFKSVGGKKYVDLANSRSSRITFSIGNLPAGSTYFLTARILSATNYTIILVNNSDNYGLHYHDNNQFYWWPDTNGVISSTVKRNNSSISIATWVNTSPIAVNQDAIFSFENSNARTLNRISGLTGNYVNMYFYSYIAFNRTLTSSEFNRVYNYLSSKFLI